jgi:hypothetical protein
MPSSRSIRSRRPQRRAMGQVPSSWIFTVLLLCDSRSIPVRSENSHRSHADALGTGDGINCPAAVSPAASPPRERRAPVGTRSQPDERPQARLLSFKGSFASAHPAGLINGIAERPLGFPEGTPKLVGGLGRPRSRGPAGPDNAGIACARVRSRRATAGVTTRAEGPGRGR